MSNPQYQESLEELNSFLSRHNIDVYYREFTNMFNVIFVVDSSKVAFMREHVPLYFPPYVKIMFLSINQVRKMNKAIEKVIENG